MCPSSEGQNCITQPLISSHLLVAVSATDMCDDTRACLMQFWPPDDEHMCSKHVEAWNKTYCETNFVHQVGLNTEMHGQQNVKRNKIFEDTENI